MQYIAYILVLSHFQSSLKKLKVYTRNILFFCIGVFIAFKQCPSLTTAVQQPQPSRAATRFPPAFEHSTTWSSSTHPRDDTRSLYRSANRWEGGSPPAGPLYRIFDCCSLVRSETCIRSGTFPTREGLSLKIQFSRATNHKFASRSFTVYTAYNTPSVLRASIQIRKKSPEKRPE